ncbi:MAG: hypothetical protein AB1430_19680 [Pseudomonadota bacterium]
MKSIRLLLAATLMAATGLAVAQPGRGPGGGPGMGPCAAATGASGVAAAGCPGGGPGMMGGGRWGRDYTPGWAMMSAEERNAHRQQMGAFKSYEECKAYMDQHHDDMAARAKERGIAMPAKPRRDACAGLKAAAK